MTTPRRSGATRLLRAGKISWAMAVMLAAVAVTVQPTLLDPVFAGENRTGAAAAAQPREPQEPQEPQEPLIVVSGDVAATAAAREHPGGRIVDVLPADGSKYFGVALAEAGEARRDPSAEFEASTGFAPTMQMTFEDFTDTFDISEARAITASGRLPVLTWEPFDHAAPTANPYPLTRIAAGDFDAYLREQGSRFAALDAPMVVRFAHEMNGAWYPWGVTAPGNTAADYIAAYRHVHSVVTAAGATNVVWTWGPNNINADTSIELASVYPGDDVVDWVGLSAYYSGHWDTYMEQFSATFAQLDAVAPSKPILIAETSVERSPARPSQTAELIDVVRESPRLIGLVWFNIDKRARWSIEEDPATAAAMGAAVRAGGFGALPVPR